MQGTPEVLVCDHPGPPLLTGESTFHPGQQPVFDCTGPSERQKHAGEMVQRSANPSFSEQVCVATENSLAVNFAGNCSICENEPCSCFGDNDDVRTHRIK